MDCFEISFNIRRINLLSNPNPSVTVVRKNKDELVNKIKLFFMLNFRLLKVSWP